MFRLLGHFYYNEHLLLPSQTKSCFYLVISAAYGIMEGGRGMFENK